jgi:uncharacterized protein (DUF433 family)
MSTTPNQYKYLARKPKSVYKQLFIKDRWVSARTVYGDFMNEEAPMTPEEIAADRDLPLEAVLEAIAYCESNPPEIQQDWEREEAIIKATRGDNPRAQPRLLTAQELARLNRL